MIIDTSVLVLLERETRRSAGGAATAFFEALTDTRICITPTIAGEVACGASMSGREVWERFLKPFECVPIDSQTVWQYGVHYRDLAGRGRLIGSNDLWIAAAALAHRMPLATSNVDEFSRVSGLRVIAV